MSSVFIDGADFGIEFPERGKFALKLQSVGCERCRIGRVAVGKFDELSALPRRFRTHCSTDRLSLEVESLGVIPFGCEYEVEREFTCCDGFAVETLDLRTATPGRLGDITLEPVTFASGWERLEYLVYGESKPRRAAGDASGVIYSGTEIPVAVALVWPDGTRVEFFCGADLWRHRAGQHTPGAHGEFVITSGADGVVFERRPLIFAPEVEPEKRPWRFKSLLAWRDARRPTAIFGENAEKFAVSDSCALAGPARRALRKAVRRADGSLTATGAGVRFCTDPAHLERPGRDGFEHFDLEEYIAAYLWGNRQLARNGGVLTFAPRPGTGFADWAVSANLASAPRPIDERAAMAR